ncbi:hypothetical protein DBR18_04230 [Pseudomonas sp. HMWF021]|nr:hypothetical protein DBR18_04230 [Pseudomonas sp. HMWF021]
MAIRYSTNHLNSPIPVGAAAGCDLLILISGSLEGAENQKIAAFGSSYRGVSLRKKSIPALGISLEKSELSFCP